MNVKQLIPVGFIVHYLPVVVLNEENLLVITAEITHCSYISIVNAGKEPPPSARYVYNKFQLAVKL